MHFFCYLNDCAYLGREEKLKTRKKLQNSWKVVEKLLENSFFSGVNFKFKKNSLNIFEVL